MRCPKQPDFGMRLAFHSSAGRKELTNVRLMIAVLLVAVSCGTAGLTRALARDDGRYANSPLKSWFDQLRSEKGPCCSDADGSAVSDADWDSRDGHYRVRLEGEWIVVPDDAVVKGPNLAGRTMVWPMYLDGKPVVRCFIPGSMT